MYPYSLSSTRKLASSDERLQRVFMLAAEILDITILTGHRGEDEQNYAVSSGHSQVEYPNSHHNLIPSKAVDATPYPIDWNDRERMTLFAGLIIGIGKGLGYNIGWGGDWNADFQVKDNHFDDLLHFWVIDDE